MPVIYEPKGRAREYSPLALNLYTGCVHGCKYCYAPGALRKLRSDFHTNVTPRKDILEKLEKDCKKMAGDPRQILLCFSCDPYQPNTLEDAMAYGISSPGGPLIEDVTRDALLILEKYRMNVTVLTEGGRRAIRDFDILQRNGWAFGTTLSFSTHKSLREWEPEPSANIKSRIEAISLAAALGIKTWVSVEPVFYISEALALMDTYKDIVGHWKVGKLNHCRDIERTIDWTFFLESVESILRGKSYYIKADLEVYRNG